MTNWRLLWSVKTVEITRQIVDIRANDLLKLVDIQFGTPYLVLLSYLE